LRCCRYVKRGAFGKIPNVNITGVAASRHSTVLAGLGPGDCRSAGKWAYWDLYTRRELSYLAIEIEIKVFDLTIWKPVRELAKHPGHIEIYRICTRYDLIDLDLEHHARLGAFDVDRPGQGMRSAARIIRPQLFDLIDVGAGHNLIVRMHHPRAEKDGPIKKEFKASKSSASDGTANTKR
jgi:hypothetical protein